MTIIDMHPYSERKGSGRSEHDCACGERPFIFTNRRKPRSGSLPARPLAEFIGRRIDKESFNPFGLSDQQRVSKMLLSRVGISERLFFAWRTGGQLTATANRVDEALIALGALWFDVYNEETVRKPALRVGSYSFESRSRGRTRFRSRVRWYGDLGPDFEALELVRREFEGDAWELAA